MFCKIRLLYINLRVVIEYSFFYLLCLQEFQIKWFEYADFNSNSIFLVGLLFMFFSTYYVFFSDTYLGITRIILHIFESWYQNVIFEPKLNILEIKPFGLVSRIRDVEAFWYKTDIKIIVFDLIDYPDPKFLISKTTIFSEVRGYFVDAMLSCKAFATNSLKWKFL